MVPSGDVVVRLARGERREEKPVFLKVGERQELHFDWRAKSSDGGAVDEDG